MKEKSHLSIEDLVMRTKSIRIRKDIMLNAALLLMSVILSVCLAGLAESANPPRLAEPPPEASTLQAKLSPKLQPAVRIWIHEQARKLSHGEIEERALQPAIQSRFAGQPLKPGDIEAVRFLVDMQAVKYMDSDIRATNEKLRSIEEQKNDLRNRMNRSGTETKVSPRKNQLDDLKAKLDGMNEMSEMTSLRLQMMMDRRSKFIETLSNIMKKIGTTEETLTQNIK